MACFPPPSPHPQGQYNSTFYTTFVPFTDYSQWERRPQKPVKQALPSKSKDKSPTGHVSKGNRSKRNCSSARVSGVKSRAGGVKSRAGVVKSEAEKRLVVSPGAGTSRLHPSSRAHSRMSQDAVKLRLLKLHVSSKRNSVEDVRHYCEQLVSMNTALITSIQSMEDKTHLTVDDMLGKYTKFKGAISRLKVKSNEQLENAREEYYATKTKLAAELAELRKMVSRTKFVLQSKLKEFQTYLNYKDKEYPIKVIRIEQLKEQIESLKESNEAEIIELDIQITEEWKAWQEKLYLIQQNLEKGAAEAVYRTKENVRETAIQNMFMEKEIVQRDKECNDLQDDIASLRSGLSRLKRSLKVNSHQQLCVTQLGKCLPSTEFTLDIPTNSKEHVPI